MKIKDLIARFHFKKLVWLLVIVVVWVNLNHERWLSKNVIHHDVANYYTYLPALFIKHDLTLSFINKPGFLPNEERYWPNVTTDGKYIIKTSMGMAILYLPFFLLAHAYAWVFNYPTHGFSEPYQFAILFSSLFYFVIGLWYLNKVLQRYFDRKAVLLTLFLLSFGTNVFYYLTIGAGLAHIVGFTLASVFIHYTLVWFESPKLKYVLLLGLTTALLVLVRPINLIVVLFFVLYGAAQYKKAAVNQLNGKQLGAHLSLMALSGIVLCIPQLIYWNYITGQYFFNSYIGERFYFDNPHILKGLLGFRKGWLIYTPIMVFSLVGFFQLAKISAKITGLILVLFCIYVYVCFSWWCWWYGGSFGQRVMIDIYPLLAFPLCAFLLKVTSISLVMKRVLYGVLAFFVFLNLFQTMQAKYNIIHFDSMTRANYLEVFFTTSKKPDRETYLKHPDYDKALKGLDEED